MAAQTVNLTPASAPASGASITPHTRRTTVLDMLEYLRDLEGASPGEQVDRIAKTAILEALREIANAHNWTYLYQAARLTTAAPYSTGTITFLVSSGTYANQLTLASGTWPTWAQYGVVRISDTNYSVDRRISSTVLTLKAADAPVADIAAGTSYTLFRDSYTLPEDFVAGDRGFESNSWGGLCYAHPSQLLQAFRYSTTSGSSGNFYTFIGSPDVPGRLALRIYPYPDAARTLDFVYKRRPRAVTLWEYATGTVTVDASGGDTTTVTGNSTSWVGTMLGSVIRFSNDTANLPTGLAGAYPATVERNIAVVNSATSFTVDDGIGDSYTTVKYRVSDPIDIEDGAMLEAFRACATKHMAVARNKKGWQDAVKMADVALLRAKEADSRSFQSGAAGVSNGYYQRLARMPMGSDVG